MINPVSRFWNKYFEYDMRPENRNKALNAAFYAVIVQITLSLVFIFFFGYSGSSLVYLELAAFFILGFLTKLDKPKAGLLLLSLFILDRIYSAINLLSTLSANSRWDVVNAGYPIFMFFAWSFLFWTFYYRAFVFQKQSAVGKLKFFGGLKPRTISGLALAFVVVAIVAGLFYWFEWMPAQIRKKCYQKPESIIKVNREKPWTMDQLNAVYRLCLVSQGMKAEDLVK